MQQKSFGTSQTLPGQQFTLYDFPTSLRKNSNNFLTKIAIKVKPGSLEFNYICYMYSDQLGYKFYKETVNKKSKDLKEFDVSNFRIGKIGVKVFSGKDTSEQSYFGI